MRGIIWYKDNFEHGLQVLNKVKKIYNFYDIKGDINSYNRGTYINSCARIKFNNEDIWITCPAELAAREGRCSIGIIEQGIDSEIIEYILKPLATISPALSVLFFEHQEEEK